MGEQGTLVSSTCSDEVTGFRLGRARRIAHFRAPGRGAATLSSYGEYDAVGQQRRSVLSTREDEVASLRPRSGRWIVEFGAPDALVPS